MEKMIVNEKFQKILDDNKDTLVNTGVVLLKPMSKEEVDAFRNYIEGNNSDIMVQVLPVNETGKNIVPFMRYTPNKNEKIKEKPIRHKAHGAYFTGDYDAAIEGLRCLMTYKFPHIKDYALLGLSYLKKHSIYLALPYLEIATSLSINSDNKYDFTDLINGIKSRSNSKNNEDIKKYVKVSIDEFSEEKNGLEVPNLRIVLYLMQTGMDILEASKHAKLSFEEIQLLYLLLAEEYYKQGNKEFGNYYLTRVKESINKSERVLKGIKLLEERRKVLLNLNTTSEDSILNGLKRVKPPKIEE